MTGVSGLLFSISVELLLFISSDAICDGECLQEKLKKQQAEALKTSQDEILKEKVENLFANLLHLLLQNIENGLKNLGDDQIKKCREGEECVITLNTQLNYNKSENKKLNHHKSEKKQLNHHKSEKTQLNHHKSEKTQLNHNESENKYEENKKIKEDRDYNLLNATSPYNKLNHTKRSFVLAINTYNSSHSHQISELPTKENTERESTCIVESKTNYSLNEMPITLFHSSYNQNIGPIIEWKKYKNITTEHVLKTLNKQTTFAPSIMSVDSRNIMQSSENTNVQSLRSSCKENGISTHRNSHFFHKCHQDQEFPNRYQFREIRIHSHLDGILITIFMSILFIISLCGMTFIFAIYRLVAYMRQYHNVLKTVDEVLDINKSLNEEVESLEISLSIFQNDARKLSALNNELITEKTQLELQLQCAQDDAKQNKIQIQMFHTWIADLQTSFLLPYVERSEAKETASKHSCYSQGAFSSRTKFAGQKYNYKDESEQSRNTFMAKNSKCEMQGSCNKTKLSNKLHQQPQ